jgi:NADPH-dependent ferric siderophore reductase
MDQDLPVRRVVRVRHEPRRRELDVAAVDRLSPGFLGITFTGESLADFVSDSFDDHVKFLVPDAGGTLVGRDYTPRRFSRADRTLRIEFAMHGDGHVDRWARQAAVGQRVTVGGPRGSMIIPTDYAWHLLAGDSSALPAICRRLEDLPADAHAIVVVHAAEEDRRELSSAARLEIRWVSTAEALVTAIRELPLAAGEGFAWAAGEAAVMARLRQVLLQDRHHPREAMRVASYWKRGASAHHETLDD